MIASLFVFELKQQLRRLAVLAALGLLLGAAAAWLYTPQVQGELRYLTQELPLVARLLGYAGSANLPVHVMGVLYGLIMPVVFVISSLTLALRLIAWPIHDGRLAQRLAAPHRRSAVLFTLFWLVGLEGLVIAALALTGQVGGAFVFLGGQADIPALVRLALGAWLSALPLSGLMVLLAASAALPSRARRLGLFLGLLFVGLMMAARLPGWAQSLRFVTPFSLMKGQELLTGAGRLLPAALGLVLGLLLAGLGAVVFSRRDL